jgi:hypothetical protein
MQNTTVLALVFVMLAQFLTLMFGVMILWWMGDFGSRDKRAGEVHPVQEVEQTTIAAWEGEPVNDNGRIVLPDNTHSIQPQAIEEQDDQRKRKMRARL